MLLAGSTRYFVYVFFLCFHTNNTFLFFLSFQKKKDHSTVYEPKVNRIHSTGLSIKTFVCPVIRVLLAQRSVFDGLYIGLRDFYFCLPPPTRQKKTHPASPRTTHSHTHHSTAQRSHEAEFSAKTSEEEKKLKQPRGQMPEIGTSQTALTALNFGRRTTGWKQIISRRDKYD